MEFEFSFFNVREVLWLLDFTTYLLFLNQVIEFDVETNYCREDWIVS